MFVSSVEHVGLLRQQRATADEILKQSKVANSSFINKQRSYLEFSYVMTLSGDFFFQFRPLSDIFKLVIKDQGGLHLLMHF